MKRISILMILLLGSIISIAQPYSINYQGIARNEKGLPYANTLISIRINIREVSPNGNIIFSETRQLTTNAQGLFSFPIYGSGASSQYGEFESINWNINKYIETEIDPTGGNDFKKIGTTLMTGVPMAIMAKQLALPFETDRILSAPLITLRNAGTGGALSVVAANAAAPGIKAHGANTGTTGILATGVAGAHALKVNGEINILSPTNRPAVNKVLTSDANGNATWQYPASSSSAFRASGLKGNVDYNQSANTGYRKVFFFEQDRYDLNDEYDAPNAIFFPKANGIYHINAQIDCNAELKFCGLSVKLLRNSVISEIATDYLGDLEDNDIYLSPVLKVALDIVLYKDDAVWVEVFFTGPKQGNTISISSKGQETWFSGHMIHKL